MYFEILDQSGQKTRVGRAKTRKFWKNKNMVIFCTWFGIGISLLEQNLFFCNTLAGANPQKVAN